MSSPKPLIVSMGDPCGIGPEVTAKAWHAMRTTGTVFAVAGDSSLYAGVPIVEIDEIASATDVFANALPILKGFSAPDAIAGQPSPRFGPVTLAAIEAGVDFVRSGAASGLVTAPISKAVVQAAGFAHPGHTEFLGALVADMPYARARGPIMMLAIEGLRVVPVTIHCALSEVPSRLSSQAIIDATLVTAQSLIADFKIPAPRIAVAALNPHAGEGGAFGDEEARLIAPAIAHVRALGIDASGPYPADSLFHAAARAKFDAVICMYHDQALIPLKALDFWGGVNITLGLPIVRTSPDHGTGFDIAGQDIANPESMIAAVKMAAHIAAHRNAS